MRSLPVSCRARSLGALFPSSPDAKGASVACGGLAHRAKHSCSVMTLHQCPTSIFDVGIPRACIAARTVRAKDAEVRAVSRKATNTMVPLLPHKTAHKAQCCRAQLCSNCISCSRRRPMLARNAFDVSPATIYLYKDNVSSHVDNVSDNRSDSQRSPEATASLKCLGFCAGP
jgi:hypothetical protein